MDKFKVKLTRQANDQIAETIDYISHQLNVPTTAMSFLDLIESELEKLVSMPEAYALVNEEPWHSQGVRKLIIKNFIAYFKVYKQDKIVWVTGFVYAGRDQTEQLKNMDFNN